MIKGDVSRGEEFICAVKRTRSTAYTEFGCNGPATKNYLLKYVMDEKDYADCRPENEVWTSHHAFKAWDGDTWLNPIEVDFFFGGYTDTDDLIDKSIYLQDMCYKSMFEEMRRQAPLCAMAVNWDFNEPWPCAAGNSLVAWPAEPKSCLKSVGEALRPTLLSLEIPRNRYFS
jgi:beta-mannosidase